MYILKRRSDHKYVAKKGFTTSYTDKLQYAQTYVTVEAAHRDICVDSEYVAELATEMVGGRK